MSKLETQQFHVLWTIPFRSQRCSGSGFASLSGFGFGFGYTSIPIIHNDRILIPVMVRTQVRIVIIFGAWIWISFIVGAGFGSPNHIIFPIGSGFDSNSRLDPDKDQEQCFSFFSESLKELLWSTTLVLSTGRNLIRIQQGFFYESGSESGWIYFKSRDHESVPDPKHPPNIYL